MHSLVLSMVPVAARYPLLAAGRSASTGQADAGRMLVSLLVAAVVIGVVCAAMIAATRFAHRLRYNSHATLFGGLCKVHGLDAASRRLLKRVVRHHRLAEPARTFVEPKWLDPASLGGSFRSEANELDQLRHRLFSVPQAGKDDSPTPAEKP